MTAYEIYLKRQLNWFDRIVVRWFCGGKLFRPADTAWGWI